MTIYFDRYYLNSRSASALLLKDRVKRDSVNDFRVFCTESVYKGTFEQEEFDSNVVTKYGLVRFTNVLNLYFGFICYMAVEGSKVSRIVSFSSPGTNLLIHGLFWWSKRVSYVVQDIFPENAELIYPFSRKFKFLWRPLFNLAYRRLGQVETISTDMRDYLLTTYNVRALIRFNTNPYSSTMTISREKTWAAKSKIYFGYSGNLGYSHGLHGPRKLLGSLVKLTDVEVFVRGFGVYFEKLQSMPELKNVEFGGSMNAQEYERFLNMLDVLLIFQEDGFEKVCLSCKFNTLIELRKPLIYVGPESDISRYILATGIGIVMPNHLTVEEYIVILNNFIKDFDNYFSAASTNSNQDLNEVLLMR